MSKYVSEHVQGAHGPIVTLRGLSSHLRDCIKLIATPNAIQLTIVHYLQAARLSFAYQRPWSPPPSALQQHSLPLSAPLRHIRERIGEREDIRIHQSDHTPQQILEVEANKAERCGGRLGRAPRWEWCAMAESGCGAAAEDLVANHWLLNLLQGVFLLRS